VTDCLQLEEGKSRETKIKDEEKARSHITHPSGSRDRTMEGKGLAQVPQHSELSFFNSSSSQRCHFPIRAVLKA
jgi:hypothetical protein